MGHRTVGRLRPDGLGAIARGMLLLAILAQGARAEDAPAPSGEPRAEGAASAMDPTPADAPAAAKPAPAENPAGAPPRRFIPTEQVSEDRAVAFPKDI